MDKQPSTSKDKKPKINPALKYAGMAMQLALTIGFGIFIGKYLDGYFETTKPYFTLLFAMVFLSAVLYAIIKDVSKG